MTNDSIIRSATRKALFTEHQGDRDTVIFDELGLFHGASRIDLVVVNGEIHGFELKSDRDTLRRLPEQAFAYGHVFDRVTLVLGERHVRHAVEIAPEWWGIRVVRRERGIRFCDLRLPRINPSIDALSVAGLLWRDEALQFLQESGVAGMRWKRRADIYSALIETVALDALRQRVRQCLRRRSNWRSVETRLSCGD